MEFRIADIFIFTEEGLQEAERLFKKLLANLKPFFKQGDRTP
jgi:hypothetical protein